MKPIYLSIKPQYTKLIHEGIKDHEFRNYIPKEEFDTLFVYVSSPSCHIRYIISLNNIIKQPNQIPETGKGNKSFNTGDKMATYAYQIKEVYELDNPISLTELREQYQFTAPQGFAYAKKYPELTKRLSKEKKRLLWQK